VLVVGNTFDPATPLGGAATMARQLARARLLTLDGYGHTALLNPSSCVSSHVASYYIDLVLPPRGNQMRARRRSVRRLTARAGSCSSSWRAADNARLESSR